MNVYHRIIVINTPDNNNPTKELKAHLRQPQYLGISYLMLFHTTALKQATVEFICSDADPAQPRTMKDIDNLLMHLKVVKELSNHRSDPKVSGRMNHRLQISMTKAPDKDDNEETEEIERG